MKSTENNKKSSLEKLDRESHSLGTGGYSDEVSDEKRYQEKMRRRKEVQQKRVGERRLG